MTVYRGTVSRVTAEGVYVIIPDLGGSNHEWGPLKFTTVAGSSVLDTVYPVGSVYLTATAGDPNTLFGGTWVLMTPELTVNMWERTA